MSEIKDVIESLSERTYYDLIELEVDTSRLPLNPEVREYFPHIIHIPVPIFLRHITDPSFALSFLMQLPSGRRRDDEFFHCPGCGLPSFYAGYCSECLDYYDINEDYDPYAPIEEAKDRIKTNILNYIERHHRLPTYVLNALYITADYSPIIDTKEVL